jgi:hypothetical protein
VFKIIQEKLRYDRQDVIWYDGDIATMENDDFKITLTALGQIRFNFCDNDFVFKGGNHERFVSEIENVFDNDDAFYEMVHNDDLSFENNNWFELVVEKSNGEPYAEFVAESVDYSTAILELKAMFDFYLQEGLSNA